MGMIFLRGKTYWIKYYRHGKPYRESTRSQKLADAKRLLKRREGEISRGKLPGIYFDRITFYELKEDFLNEYRVNKRKSLVRAERSMRRLSETFEGFRVTEITSPGVVQYITDRMEEGAANATINRELSALKRALNLGAKATPNVNRVPHISNAG